MQGQGVAGLGQLQEGLAAFRTTDPGDSRIHPVLPALQAKTAARVGQVETALVILDEALADVATVGERHSEAELYRLQGELLLQATAQPRTPGACQPPSNAAEVCFR
jgi:hypothetical protein